VGEGGTGGGDKIREEFTTKGSGRARDTKNTKEEGIRKEKPLRRRDAEDAEKKEESTTD
jgi:hypothetical protein